MEAILNKKKFPVGILEDFVRGYQVGIQVTVLKISAFYMSQYDI